MSEPLSGRSLSFDRVADLYDETRGDDDEVLRSVEVLGEELPHGGRCLEVGIGTGRMAVPLHERGFDLVGVDLSHRMMSKLRSKYPAAVPFPLVQADATRMPFTDDSFAAAYSIWVLHLVPGWRRVIDEVVRTVARGGSFIVSLGGQFGAGPWDDITKRYRALTEAENVGAANIGEVDEEMVARGSLVHELDSPIVEHEVTPAEVLRRLDDGCYSFTWLTDEGTRRAAVRETRTWAEERFGDLEAPLTNRFGAAWRRYELR